MSLPSKFADRDLPRKIEIYRFNIGRNPRGCACDATKAAKSCSLDAVLIAFVATPKKFWRMFGS